MVDRSRARSVSARPWLLTGTVTLLFATGVFPASALAQSQPFAFGLWGDMPYAKAKDGPRCPR
jgi:hypothetical protein